MKFTDALQYLYENKGRHVKAVDWYSSKVGLDYDGLYIFHDDHKYQMAYVTRHDDFGIEWEIVD